MKKTLFELLLYDVAWRRKSGCGGADSPLIGGILAWQMERESADDHPDAVLKFQTPRIIDLCCLAGMTR